MEMRVENTLSILVVDDDENLRNSIVLNLEETEWHISSVAGGQQALELQVKEAFDIILADLRMPEMDGMTFLEQCKSTYPDTSIVLMTAFGNNEIALEAIRRGASDYISKPFSSQELIFTLKKVAERRNLQAENEELKSAISGRNSLKRSKDLQTSAQPF